MSFGTTRVGGAFLTPSQPLFAMLAIGFD